MCPKDKGTPPPAATPALPGSPAHGPTLHSSVCGLHNHKRQFLKINLSKYTYTHNWFCFSGESPETQLSDTTAFLRLQSSLGEEPSAKGTLAWTPEPRICNRHHIIATMSCDQPCLTSSNSVLHKESSNSILHKEGTLKLTVQHLS